MYPHRDPIPFENAELRGKCGERLGAFIEFGLPIASGEVKGRKPFLRHSEVDERLCAGEWELVVLE